MRVGRILFCFALCLATPGLALRAQQESAQKKPDTFFAGTVTEFSAQKIAVSRPGSGKIENRAFRITPQTKIEGKLRVKGRVNVRYITDDTGDVATLIIVRATHKPK